MASDSAFRSVKLAAALVDDARAAASTMRRSVASQIEYWATLGRSLESAGLTTRDTSALIARQDAAAYAVRGTRTPDDAELENLKTHVVALAKSGALALRAREAVAANAASAVPAKGAGKARRAT
jgi:hypothetical protein